MTDLSPFRQRVLALLLLAAAVLLFTFGVALPIMAGYSARAAERERLAATFQLNERRIASLPALANEARVEARGGVIWVPGQSEGTAGIAAGYDFDLGSSAFAGLEVSGDKILTSGTHVAVGFTGRGGAKLGGGKLFATGGYTTSFATGADGQWHAGAGYEHGFGNKFYGKVEYRHFFEHGFTTDADAVVAGLGMKF